MDKVRVLLLTDSLGCPRVETDVTNTWTEKVVREFSGNKLYFYTYCVHGLSTKTIPIEYIYEIKPDLMIVQVGIVDACRRAMPQNIEKIIRHIPLFSKIIRYFCRMWHFEITKFFNIHYSTSSELLYLFEDILKKMTCTVLFIPIAPAGTIMKQKVYHLEEDIDEYNNVFNILKKTYTYRIKILNPYGDKKPDELFIHDGHHLNEKAHKIVFKEVELFLNNLIRGK